MNSSTDADIARIRTVASDWPMAKDGPKNIEASTTITVNVEHHDRELRRQICEELERHHRETRDRRDPHVPAPIACIDAEPIREVTAGKRPNSADQREDAR